MSVELAFDTATAACAVAIRIDGRTDTVTPDSTRMLESPAHARELLPSIELLLARNQVSFADLTDLAVGVGPGAFTGLRIGVTTARAIATARGIGIKPVSSLAALQAGAEDPNSTVALIDARRNEIFCRIGDGEHLVSPERAVELAAGEVAHGTAIAVGDGALKLADQLREAGLLVPEPGDPRHVVSVNAMLDLAKELQPVPANTVVPNYIRPPDAKVSARESWLVGSTNS